ncbi:unnamed protein product [Paramecium primaurelia]|uniref:Uncharacterized protein n=1 Tax=Paramecium primaurelia TaxID=5886 RepID=A0A8S1QQY8_PARPR|nr:unnamed protein product [Paramecium primaurelia]
MIFHQIQNIHQSESLQKLELDFLGSNLLCQIIKFFPKKSQILRFQIQQSFRFLS